MKEIEEAIKFIEEIVIECEPNTGCGRCDDARKVLEGLKRLLNPFNDLHIPDVSKAKRSVNRVANATAYNDGYIKGYEDANEDRVRNG